MLRVQKDVCMPEPQWSETTVTVATTDVHMYRGGEGPPLLFLHGGGGNPGWLMCHQALARHFTVYAPSHPGFGRTSRPEWINHVSDMSVFYLWLLEELGVERVHLMGHSFGGWLAADMAAVCPQVVERLVLVSAVGLKPQRGEILDIFLITPEEVRAKTFYKPEQVPEWEQLYGRAPTPEEVERSEEALAMMVRLCWKPYMHDPRLPALLARIKRPTLVVWGRQDAIVPLACGELYHHGIAASQLVVIDECGHAPHLEKPQAFANAVLSFLTQ
jgi:pimeloyl-ACP methyl ester carboxylesterase